MNGGIVERITIAHCSGGKFHPCIAVNGHAGSECRTLSADERQPARNLAALLHPAWEKCSRGVRALHARNAGVPVRDLAVDSPRDVCLFLRDLRLADRSGGSAGRVPLASGEGE